jgi:hypothetical protein
MYRGTHHPNLVKDLSEETRPEVVRMGFDVRRWPGTHFKWLDSVGSRRQNAIHE